MKLNWIKENNALYHWIVTWNQLQPVHKKKIKSNIKRIELAVMEYLQGGQAQLFLDI